MKYFLFFLLVPFSVFSQFNTQKEKYWIYRERLKNYLVRSIPANSRGNDGVLDWGDSPWMIGYWVGTLAMEYNLLTNACNSGSTDACSLLNQTKQDLYDALEAINRLDYNAETSWGCSASLNGFLMRDDVPANIPQNLNSVDWLNESWVSPIDNFRVICINSAFTKYVPAGSEASLDHLIGLYVGLSLVKANVPPTASWNNTPFSYETITTTTFVGEVQNISDRIINWLSGHGWT